MGYLDTLNSKQKEAVLATEGPVLILAGAGSGKTRVLVHRIAYLIDNNGVNPWNILAITFTNKAAEEMRNRVDKLIGQGADSIWVSTFHSMCVRILRRHIDLIGYDTNFTIYDTDDSKSVMKDIFKRLGVDSKYIKERAVLSAISSAKDELISPEEFKKNSMGDYRQELMAKLYVEYQETLQKANALDFDDLIVRTVELFKEAPQVLDNYQERFRYIMVDEYQDTNTAQFELVRLLAGKYRNLCVVGDDDQSIYKFRGANINNILDYEKVFEEAKVIKLEQNYRSTQNILDAANAVIANNNERKQKSLWTDKGAGSRIHYRQVDTAFEEADYIAGDIAKAVRDGKVRYSDCAVLYRTNAQSRLLEEAFVREGMPYNIVGGVNFYSRREIKDILAYLKTIDNAVDDLAVKRIINVPKRSIGQTTVNKVTDYALAGDMSFYDALNRAEDIPGLGKTAAKLTAFVNMIRVFRSKAEFMSIEELIKDVIETTGYVKELEESDEDDAEDRIENIDELITKAKAYGDDEPEGKLADFLAEVALVADIDSLDDNADKSLLMTLHGAKGLEFRRVYIAGAEEGVFPGMASIYDEDPTAIEEERRLAYVGITRAMEDLTITSAKVRMIRGETQYNSVSRFVREIPEDLLDDKPAKKKTPVYDGVPIETYAGDSAQTMAFKSKPYGGYTEKTSSYPRAKAIIKDRSTPAGQKPYILSGSTGAASAGTKPSYDVGDRVMHQKYGEGTVTALSLEPRDYKVTVDFDEVGTKIMYATFAKLKKI